MKLVSMVLALALMLPAAVWAQDSATLTVTGNGHFESVPDMASITMGMTAQARTATAALAENSKNSAVMLAVIEELGVAPRDMQTSGLSLSALWNNRSSGSNERPDIVGYSANSQVTIRVRDLNNLGSILDSVVKSGANGFNGLQFGLQDPVPAQDNARAAAVADAKRKAELYAKAAGISLGPIHTLSEAGSSSPQPVMLREMAMSDAVPIAQGEVSMRASVTIVYEILQ